MTVAASRESVVVGLVQMSMLADTARNIEHAIDLVRQAAASGATLICLPELFSSRYFCQVEDTANFDLAESVPGPTTETLAALAAELDVVIIANVFERRAAGIFHNTAAVLDGKHGYRGKYRKMHIPDDPRYFEKFYFTPGDLGFKSFSTGSGELGVLICWDQWYPEAARLTALKGAQILIYPTAIGWHPEEKAQLGQAQHAAWETIQRSHAVANGCYVAAVNRVGFEGQPGADGGIDFWGGSFVAGPDGQVLARAPSDSEHVLTVPLDLAAIEETRVGWPFFRDRRIDAYAGLVERYLDTDAEEPSG
ncbi:MAG: carbon-nitrogen hydrolase [Gammaproteobacteria bacterium]|nr:carbon-nitrogen hydrolase [Gammaproteobacteria bacterium]